MNSFYSAKWDSIFYHILLIKYQKKFLTVLYIAMVAMVTYTEAWNVAFKTSKHKNIIYKIKFKNKINIFYKTNLKEERKVHSIW